MPRRTPMSLALNALPGWLMLAGGLALMAGSMTVPPLHTAAAMQRQRDTLDAHLVTRQARLDRLRQLAHALDDADPTLLARVAHDRWGMTADDPDVTTLAPPTPDLPLALDGVDVAPIPDAYVPPDNAITRITTGPHRAALPVVGLVFVAAGVTFPWRDRSAGADA